MTTEGYTSGFDHDVMRYTDTGHDPRPDTKTGDGQQRFGSSHPGGFMTVFADGTVQFISYDIDKQILPAWDNETTARRFISRSPVKAPQRRRSIHEIPVEESCDEVVRTTSFSSGHGDPRLHWVQRRLFAPGRSDCHGKGRQGRQSLGRTESGGCLGDRRTRTGAGRRGAADRKHASRSGWIVPAGRPRQRDETGQAQNWPFTRAIAVTAAICWPHFSEQNSPIEVEVSADEIGGKHDLGVIELNDYAKKSPSSSIRRFITTALLHLDG